jgi:hypothetical protein
MPCDIIHLDSALLGNIIVAMATIFATALGVYLVRFVNRKIDERKDSFEEEERILKSLEYLTGGTQSRSAGLGIIEGLLLINDEGGPSAKLRNVFLPVIRNQLIYLSTTSKQKMEIHEHDNFARLLDVWKKLNPKQAEIEPLRRALDARVDETRGLEFVGGYRSCFEDLQRSVSKIR